jgi:hypothetical protein
MQERRERRVKQRYPTHLPVTVIRGFPEPDIHGVTRDISSSGIYFYVQGWTPTEPSIDIRISLPLEIKPATDVSAACSATVVRVEDTGIEGRIGIAATIDNITLWDAIPK